MRGDTEDVEGAVAAPDTRPIDLPVGLLAGPGAVATVEPAPPTVPTGISLPSVVSLPAQGRAVRDDAGAPATPTSLSWGLPLGAALHAEPRPANSDGLGLALLPEPPRRWGADSSPAVQRLASPPWVPPARVPVPAQAPAYPPVEWVDGAGEPRARFGFTAQDLAYLGAPLPQVDDVGERRRALGPRRSELRAAAGPTDVWVVPRRLRRGATLGVSLEQLAGLVARLKVRLAVLAVVTAVAVLCGTVSLLASRTGPATAPPRSGPSATAGPASEAVPAPGPGAEQPGVARAERDRVAGAASGVLVPTALPVAAGVTRQAAVSRGGASVPPRRSGRAPASAPAGLPGASAVAVYPNLPDLPAPSVSSAAPTDGAASTVAPTPSDPVPAVSSASTGAPASSSVAPSPVPVDPGAASPKGSAG